MDSIAAFIDSLGIVTALDSVVAVTCVLVVYYLGRIYETVKAMHFMQHKDWTDNGGE